MSNSISSNSSFTASSYDAKEYFLIDNNLNSRCKVTDEYLYGHELSELLVNIDLINNIGECKYSRIQIECKSFLSYEALNAHPIFVIAYIRAKYPRLTNQFIDHLLANLIYIQKIRSNFKIVKA